LLAVPTLSSLLPRVAQAQSAEPKLRYVQWMMNHGQFEENFWPAAKYLPTDVVAPGIRARALSSIEGPISTVISEAFNPLRGKFSLLRGLDVISPTHYHTESAASCASAPTDDGGAPVFTRSVDAALESSKRVYAVAPRVPALRLTPGAPQPGSSFCWTMQNGKPFRLPCMDRPDAALQRVFSAPPAPGTKSTAPQLADMVLADYRSVSNGSRIGAADKVLLANYMDLLGDVQRRMQVPLMGCAAPSQVSDVDFETVHQNAIDVAVAAMLCGATRVVAYHTEQGSATQNDGTTFHGWAHNDAQKHGAMMRWRYKQLARLLTRMDAFTESNGKTLLDNSLVYAGNGLSKPGHGTGHLQNMPLLLAGSAGGTMPTGQYIDFGKRLVNNLLVTLLQKMGSTPDEYELASGQGFGSYNGDNLADYAAYTAPSERNKPLPYLTQG
jgi:hypothetical protein